MSEKPGAPQSKPATPQDSGPAKPVLPKQIAQEIGGPTGPEPTRYGDWERNGRVSDF